VQDLLGVGRTVRVEELVLEARVVSNRPRQHGEYLKVSIAFFGRRGE
jgi:hypothetical protein